MCVCIYVSITCTLCMYACIHTQICIQSYIYHIYVTTYLLYIIYLAKMPNNCNLCYLNNGFHNIMHYILYSYV